MTASAAAAAIAAADAASSRMQPEKARGRPAALSPLGSRVVDGYRISTLPGGQRVVSERIDGVRSIAIGFWIGAGSRRSHRGRDESR